MNEFVADLRGGPGGECLATNQPDGKGGIVYGCLRRAGHEPPHYWGNHVFSVAVKDGLPVGPVKNECAECCEIHPKEKR